MSDKLKRPYCMSTGWEPTIHGNPDGAAAVRYAKQLEAILAEHDAQLAAVRELLKQWLFKGSTGYFAELHTKTQALLENNDIGRELTERLAAAEAEKCELSRKLRFLETECQRMGDECSRVGVCVQDIDGDRLLSDRVAGMAERMAGLEADRDQLATENERLKGMYSDCLADRDEWKALGEDFMRFSSALGELMKRGDVSIRWLYEGDQRVWVVNGRSGAGLLQAVQSAKGETL